MDDQIESIRDRRTKSDSMREDHRDLTEEEKARIKVLKDVGRELLGAINDAGFEGASGRELAIARTKVEEAVMWAVKAVTA